MDVAVPKAARGCTSARYCCHLSTAVQYCRDSGPRYEMPTKRTRTDRPEHIDHTGSFLSSDGTDPEQPHVPRRKRSKWNELTRSVEALAAVNAATAAGSAHGAHADQDDYDPRPLSSLAAAAAAELTRSPQYAKQVCTCKYREACCEFSVGCRAQLVVSAAKQICS